ncbi:MAG TPA: hypothetical protein VJ123_04490 [Anaerolineales bacterium]|nr:hypothetical protein [Anaerolineales bacterium]
MSQPPLELWESQVRIWAGAFPYPPTPELAAAVSRRLQSRAPARRRLARLAWALAAVALLLAGMLSVPPVRAALGEWLRLGAVRILLGEPTPDPTLKAPSPTATPSPTMAAPEALLDIAGETSLEAAQRAFGSSIPLPAYPPDLGLPDRIFSQGGSLGRSVVLVWLEAGHPEDIRLSLHLLRGEDMALKGMVSLVRETAVHGARALWVEGEHFYELTSGEMAIRRLVEGNVLIWTAGEVTFRLESGLPLEQAVRVAESLE